MNEKMPNKPVSRFNRYYRQITPTLEKPKVRIYTTIVFSFLAISLFGWYAIRPTLQTIIFLNREIQDKTKLNNQLEQKIASLIEAQAAYQDAQPLLLVLDEAIPALPEALDLTAQIRNITFSREATYSAISVNNIPLAKTETKAKSDLPNITKNFQEAVELTGDYKNLEAIITDIHRMRRLATMKSISFVPSDGETQSTRSATTIGLDLNSFIEAYYKN
jgi:Tfp pilus assembly protein PilO